MLGCPRNPLLLLWDPPSSTRNRETSPQSPVLFGDPQMCGSNGEFPSPAGCCFQNLGEQKDWNHPKTRTGQGEDGEHPEEISRGWGAPGTAPHPGLPPPPLGPPSSNGSTEMSPQAPPFLGCIQDPSRLCGSHGGSPAQLGAAFRVRGMQKEPNHPKTQTPPGCGVRDPSGMNWDSTGKRGCPHLSAKSRQPPEIQGRAGNGEEEGALFNP